MILAEYYYKICPICDHQNPKERNYIKGNFLWCLDCGAIAKKNNAKTLETTFYPPSKEDNEGVVCFLLLL